LLVTLDPLPAINITGLPDLITPGQQPGVGIEASAAYPADITGRLDLEFTPDPPVAGVDPALQFSTGGRSVEFRIPAGQTRAVFSQTGLALQTGTVAGTATLRLTTSVAGQSARPSNTPDRSVRIRHMEPVLNSVTLERRTDGFNVVIVGFSTTREVSEASVTLVPATGRDLQSTRIVVPLTAFFRTWYDGAASFPFGTQFKVTMPFNGDNAAIQAVTVRLRNSIGESEERRVTF
ncbi:MAG TPA: hypothetical protein VM120_28270, partial [Bryobacteraceae bacterium]|nr:hypothetical protein [Bryobacteraceae bacterium]